MNKKRFNFFDSIFTQSVIIVIVFTLFSLVLSSYFFRQNMKMVAMEEVENKAIIFLSAMETSTRQFVMNRESQRLTELMEEKVNFLEGNLNFTIIRVIVQDPQGQILDHTRPEKIGQSHSTDDFQEVITSGRPLVKRKIKTLKLEPGKPEIQVIEITYPINNLTGDIVAIVRIILDVRRTFENIQKEYWQLNRRVILGFCLASFLLIIGTLFFLRRKIIIPVIQVAKGSARVASGDLEFRLVPRGNDEISKLIHSFNQMVEGLKQRDKMQRSLEIAREVQQKLLPKNDPNFRGLDIAGTSLYCDETGGDYYDFFKFDENETGKIGIVLGDVSGHGIPSALLMATTRAFLRQRVALPGNISQIMSDINLQLVRDIEGSGSFMTMFYMTINRTNKSLKWVRAGHDPAIFYDPNTNKISQLKGEGIALGVDENRQYLENEKKDLAKGQIIVLGTDGIWEARNTEGKMFGKEPLYKIIRENAELDAKSIQQSIIQSLLNFQDNCKVEDDITLVVVKLSDF